MLDDSSLSTRFLVSLASNATRSLLGFVSGMLVARGLSPAGYGDLTFLLGSFVAVRSLLDMGSSNAFYTFISQQRRARSFYRAYCLWLVLQFFVILCAVGLIMPDSLLARAWLGRARYVVLLSFVASFLQQQVWQTVNQIGEASRKTVRVQVIGMVVAVIHLAVVSLLFELKSLSVSFMFLLIIAEYLGAAIWALWFLRSKLALVQGKEPVPAASRGMLDEYWVYCKPLVILSLVTFCYEFADRWMLQRFGGAIQQGFYQVAFQFSAVSLLATSSILNVFWKEVAEAHGRGDAERLALIYRRVSRGLVMVGAIISGFLIPWTDQIVHVFLGDSYLLAAPALLIMFFFPIHQSMGQISGTMMLACGQTRSYMVISVIFMALSLPVSYLMQAPPSGTLVCGLGMGALGMALKMVLLNIVSVNVQAWVIARYSKWRFDWFYQVVGIASVLALGYASRLAIGALWHLDASMAPLQLAVPVLAAAALYAGMVLGLLWMMPWLMGAQRAEIRSFLAKYRIITVP